MIEAPIALAFAAGLVATVNPCGFAMLPAYLAYFMGMEDDPEGRGSVRNALTVGTVVSSGFLLVFGVAGIFITLGLRFVIDLIPWLAILVGFGVIGLGVAMLFGYQLTVGLPKAKRASTDKGYRSVFAFGVSYAVASLSCTLPVFLTVVATQVTRGTFAGGIVTFLAYGAGMSLVLVGVTVALAFGKQGLISRLKSSMRYIGKVSGACSSWPAATSSGSGRPTSPRAPGRSVHRSPSASSRICRSGRRTSSQPARLPLLRSWLP